MKHPLLQPTAVRAVRSDDEVFSGLDLPTRQTDLAAGYDLHAACDSVISPKSQTLIPVGWHIAIPPGWVGMIRDRSGHALKRRLTIRAGVIDSDFRGEVCVLMVNESPVSQVVERGKRIAQLIIVPCLQTDFVEVDSLDETHRGTGGFGHTGA